MDPSTELPVVLGRLTLLRQLRKGKTALCIDDKQGKDDAMGYPGSVCVSQEFFRHAFIAFESDRVFAKIIDGSIVAAVQRNPDDAFGVLQQIGLSREGVESYLRGGNTKQRSATNRTLLTHPNCEVFCLRQGHPRTGVTTSRYILTTTHLPARTPLVAELQSIARSFDEEAWYRQLNPVASIRLSVGAWGWKEVPDPVRLRWLAKDEAAVDHQLSLGSEGMSSAALLIERERLIKDRQIMATLRGVIPCRTTKWSGQSRAELPKLDRWPSEVPYCFGTATLADSANSSCEHVSSPCADNGFTVPPPELYFPYSLLKMQECAELGSGQLELVAAEDIPYGTLFLYGGFVREDDASNDDNDDENARSHTYTFSLGSEKAPRQRKGGAAAKKKRKKTDNSEANNGDTATYSLEGSSIARYINQYYNFAPFGNVSLLTLFDAPCTGFPSGLTTPCFVAATDIEKGQRILAASYGPSYDAELEVDANCSGLPLSAHEARFLQHRYPSSAPPLLAEDVASVPRPYVSAAYNADYRGALAEGHIVFVRQWNVLENPQCLVLGGDDAHQKPSPITLRCDLHAFLVHDVRWVPRKSSLGNDGGPLTRSLIGIQGQDDDGCDEDVEGGNRRRRAEPSALPKDLSWFDSHDSLLLLCEPLHPCDAVGGAASVSAKSIVGTKRGAQSANHHTRHHVGSSSGQEYIRRRAATTTDANNSSARAKAAGGGGGSGSSSQQGHLRLRILVADDVVASLVPSALDENRHIVPEEFCAKMTRSTVVLRKELTEELLCDQLALDEAPTAAQVVAWSQDTTEGLHARPWHQIALWGDSPFAA